MTGLLQPQTSPSLGPVTLFPLLGMEYAEHLSIEGVHVLVSSPWFGTSAEGALGGVAPGVGGWCCIWCLMSSLYCCRQPYRSGRSASPGEQTGGHGAPGCDGRGYG